MDWFHNKSPSDVHLFQNILGDWYFLGVLIYSTLLDNEIRLKAPSHIVENVSTEGFHFFRPSVKATADKT